MDLLSDVAYDNSNVSGIHNARIQANSCSSKKISLQSKKAMKKKMKKFIEAWQGQARDSDCVVDEVNSKNKSNYYMFL